METHQGIIALYSEKGWGFIEGSNGRWYFHISNCVSGFIPALGIPVDFEVGPPFKLVQKEQALHVRATAQATAEATSQLKRLGASLAGAL